MLQISYDQYDYNNQEYGNYLAIFPNFFLTLHLSPGKGLENGLLA